ncbi:hypothetical protein N9S04_00095 [bacterium]|nr:hypothetical protein [bacterium]
MKEFQWEKIGMIYEVNNNHPSLLSHASNPLALHLSEDIYRIFYSGRDKDNRSAVSYVDYDVIRKQIVNDFKEPIVVPEYDTFYSHGITIGNHWQENGETYIGFMGWQQKDGEHWRGDIGKFNLTTREVSMLLGINEEDSVSLSYPHIIHENDIYKMWYGSTNSWSSVNGEMIHVIKYATSKDLKSWNFKGTCIPYVIGEAQAFSKPSVYKDQSGYHMWYSYRGGDGIPYRIGYGFSKTGEDWSTRQSNLTVSSTGWDDDMVCYPYVFKHKDQVYMVYNGNRYGLKGFGLATAKV